MERFQAGFFGFHPLFGGMKPGSGFALGTSHSVTKDLKVSAQASLKGAQKYEAAFVKPHFLNKHFFAEVRSTYTNNPQEIYYGNGNDTRSEDRTNFRLEARTIGGQIGVNAQKHVKVGADIGWTNTTLGTGTSRRFPTVANVFDTADLAAYEDQPTYLRVGAIVDADYRDEPGNPRDGGRYLAKWSTFQDQIFGLYDFTQYDAEVQQYIPFFNQRRVIALRAKTTLTQTGEGQQIPFYMLPTLGGTDDLRGYADFRFREKNMVVFNAEYRFEAFSALDLAVFADAGQVASAASDFSFSEMKTAAGIGLRFNTAKKVIYRLDVGFSHEGTRVSMKFGNVF